MSEQYSFATLPSEKVLELCEKARDRIDKRMAENVEEHIASLMNRRFFRCKTREAAIKSLQNTDVYFGHSKWDRIQCSSWAGEGYLRLERLTRLAKLSPTVNVCAKDMDLF